jgi:type II secretory pathway pseudopilin PulG
LAEIVVVVVIVLVLGVLLALQFTRLSARDGVSITKGAMRSGDQMLQEYRARFGQYPPHETSGTVYLPFSRMLVRPVEFYVETTSSLPSGRAGYQGPPLDPYRKESSLQGEAPDVARASGHEGDLTVRGYPLRYYRSARGDWALLIGNGPDERMDLNARNIAQATSAASGAQVFEALKPYLYDPTNGTVSSGDIVRVVEPAEDRSGRP